MTPRVVLFGDTFGVPITVRCLSRECIAAVVAAAIRPQSHAPLRAIALELGVPFLVQPKHGAEGYAEFVRALEAVRPEFLVVNSYSMLLRPEMLALAARAAVNVHPAPLPRYRGSNPWQWALLSRERATAVTLHHMTAAFDDGDVVAQEPVPILFDDTWLDIQRRIAVATEALLARELPRLLDGTAARTPQDESAARHWRRRTAEDGRIDWAQSVVGIYHLVRALVHPHPGAFYERDGQRAVVDSYRSIPQVIALKYGPETGRAFGDGETVLATLAVDDVPAVEGWTDDPAEAPVEPRFRRTDADWAQARFAALQARNDLLFFALRSAEDGEAAGWAQLRNVSWAGGSAEAHVWMAQAAEHGGPRHQRVLRLLADFAFRELELRRLLAPALAGDAAAGALERAGFQSACGAGEGAAIYALTRNEHAG